ncbi:MAG: hypothetical protein WDW36_008085 [Sanguina aurantia]
MDVRALQITIIGGSYIAVEFVGIFKRLGAEVHVVYRQDLPLRGFDEESRKSLKKTGGTTNNTVGAHMLGDHAAEIMQGCAVAVKVGVTKEQMDGVVGIHPSAAEAFVTMETATRMVVRETAAAATHSAAT